MKKIPTIFMRAKCISDRVYDVINPECQWVFDRDENDEYVGGVLRKYDGLCCMIENGVLWKRAVVPSPHEISDNLRQSLLIQLDDINNTDIVWYRVPINEVHSQYFEAYKRLIDAANGTYELIGPDINGNPEKCDSVRLMRHDHAPSVFIPNRNFEDIKWLLEHHDIYGYVFVHPDGRKAKINRTHFGFDRLKRGVH